MNKEEQYVLEKTSFLHSEFLKFEKTLNSKYNIKISFDAHYDSLFISGKKRRIAARMGEFIARNKRFCKKYS